MSEDQDRAEAIRDLLALCPRLEKLGHTRITVEYGGSGDEGGVEGVECDGDEDLPKNLETAIENAAESIYPQGFYNNEGGAGTITLLVKEQIVRVEHGWYETELVSDDPHDYTAADAAPAEAEEV